MSTHERTGYTEIRNETCRIFGVVAAASSAVPEERDFLRNTESFDRAHNHSRSQTLFFPLPRVGEPEPVYGWDPKKEYQIARKSDEPLMGMYAVPDDLKRFKERYPNKLWFGLVAYEIGNYKMRKAGHVVTGYAGERLEPFIRAFNDGGKMAQMDWHRQAWFVNDHFGRVHIGRRGGCDIDRVFSRVDQRGFVIVQGENVGTDVPFAKDTFTFPKEFGEWQPALSGLAGRRRCNRLCRQAHYAS